jgi:hypothetical protein
MGKTVYTGLSLRQNQWGLISTTNTVWVRDCVADAITQAAVRLKGELDAPSVASQKYFVLIVDNRDIPEGYLSSNGDP